MNSAKKYISYFLLMSKFCTLQRIAMEPCWILFRFSNTLSWTNTKWLFEIIFEIIRNHFFANLQSILHDFRFSAFNGITKNQNTVLKNSGIKLYIFLVNTKWKEKIILTKFTFCKYVGALWLHWIKFVKNWCDWLEMCKNVNFVWISFSFHFVSTTQNNF